MILYDVIIIGGGPAGLAASVQLTRFGLSSLILEANRLGGLVANANLMENYLGFPDGIKGIDFIDLIIKQAINHNINYNIEEVISVAYQNDLFRVSTNKNEYYSKYLIGATGTYPKIPNIRINSEVAPFVKFDVYDLINCSGSNIAIVGAGDAAFDYAINLASKNNNITIYNRSNKTKAIQLLIERSSKFENIKYFESIEILDIILNSQNEQSIRLIIKDSENYNFEYNFLIFAIGREPNNSLFNDVNKQKKFYLIGDAKNGILRQTAISVGDGLKSAQQIFNSIENENQSMLI